MTDHSQPFNVCLDCPLILKQLVFSGQVGPQKVQAELKVTNREFHLQHTICELKNNPCIHLRVNSVLSDVDWKHFTHNLLVAVDLRPLGFAHEFNLKADTKRDGFFIDHTFDTQIRTADQKDYQFNFYLKPSKAGIELSIPKRKAAIEAIYEYPKDFIGRYQATITSYLDKKNNPSKHSTIGFTGEIKRPSNLHFVSSGSLIASHPSVKDLKISGETEFNGEKQLISGNVKFDVFKQTNQAIVVAAKFVNSDTTAKGYNLVAEISLKSPGLGLDYVYHESASMNYQRRAIAYTYELRGPSAKDRFGLYLNGDIKKIDLSVVLFDEEILKGTAEFDKSKRSASLQSTVKLLGSEPIHSHGTASFSTVNAHIKQGDFLSIEADATVGKALSFKATGNKKVLVNVNVALDKANLLSTDYDVNDKEFREFIVSSIENAANNPLHIQIIAI